MPPISVRRVLFSRRGRPENPSTHRRMLESVADHGRVRTDVCAAFEEAHHLSLVARINAAVAEVTRDVV